MTEQKSAFARCHPAAGFLYYAVVLYLNMSMMHPVSLLLALAGAAAFSLSLNGRGELKFQLAGLLPLLLLTAVLNACFNHEGMTHLFWLPGGNEVTLESLIYGLCAALMLVSVLLWLRTYLKVMPSDKFIWLFGRILPALSLLLSMTLRFLPLYTARMKRVMAVHRGLNEPRTGLQKLRMAAASAGAVLTWALEHAAETADSMSSRGWGLPHRTSFTTYVLSLRDRVLMAWSVFCGLYLTAGRLAGLLSWRFYPTMRMGSLSPMSVSMWLCELLLFLTPTILDREEMLRWKRSASEI